MALPIPVDGDVVEEATAFTATGEIVHTTREGRTASGLRRGGQRWSVDSAWRTAVLGDDASDWFDLGDDKRAVLVKSGWGRTVWRVNLPSEDRSVYAKVFQPGGILERLKSLAFGSPAQREWRIARAAAVRGVPVAWPVAIGWQRGVHSGSVYLSASLGPARSLLTAWQEDVAGLASARHRRAEAILSRAVVRLFVTAWERSFFHRDGHPSNILVCDGAGNEPQAFFVDLLGARVTNTRAADRNAVRSLAQLDQSFQRVASRAQRLRFLCDFLTQRRGATVSRPGREEWREWVQRILTAREVYAAHLVRQRDRRLGRDGKYFASLRLGGRWKAWVVLQLARRHVFPEPGVVDRSVKDWKRELSPLLEEVESRGTAGLAERPSAGLRFSMLQPRSVWEKLLWTVIGSPHRRAFESCHKLRHHGQPSELMMGVVEHRTFGLIDATILIGSSGAGCSENIR